MKLLSKILRLTPRQYHLYAKVILLSAVARLAVLLFPFHRIAASLQSGKNPMIGALSAEKATIVEEIALAVTRVARYTPWRCMCLEQGLMAKVLLRHMDIPSTLVFGVATQAESTIVAHAWLHCGQKLVVGEKGMSGFKVIASFT